VLGCYERGLGPSNWTHVQTRAAVRGALQVTTLERQETAIAKKVCHTFMQFWGVPVTDLFVKCRLKLHIDIRPHLCACGLLLPLFRGLLTKRLNRSRCNFWRACGQAQRTMYYTETSIPYFFGGAYLDICLDLSAVDILNILNVIQSVAARAQLGQLSLASLRGRLIEYQLRLG